MFQPPHVVLMIGGRTGVTVSMVLEPHGDHAHTDVQKKNELV